MKQSLIILSADWKEYWTRQVSLIDDDKNKRISLKFLYGYLRQNKTIILVLNIH